MERYSQVRHQDALPSILKLESLLQSDATGGEYSACSYWLVHAWLCCLHVRRL